MVFFTIPSAFSQQPSHFYLGQQELAGIDIYDIIQDKDNYYWLATDHGIIRYDSYHFEKLHNPKILSTSVFDLKLDNNGIAYGKNFSGQILQLRQDSISIVFHLADSLFSGDYTFDFDINNALIIGAKNILKFKNNTLTALRNTQTGTGTLFYDFTKLKSGELITHEFRKNAIYKIGNELISEELNLEKNQRALNFVILNNELYCYDIQTSILYKKNENTLCIVDDFNRINNHQKLLRFYNNQNSLWVAHPKGGVKIFNHDLTALYGGKSAFKDEFISTVYQDNSGNFILGTFGKGLIIVPEMENTAIAVSKEEGEVNKIATGNGKLYIGTTKGLIYEYDDISKEKTLIAKSTKHIDALEFLAFHNKLLFDDKNSIIFDPNTKENKLFTLGAIKDIYPIPSKKSYLLATNNNLKLLKPDFSYEIIPSFQGRSNRTGYNEIHQLIYTGTSSGLKIGTEQTSDYVLKNGNPIVVKDIMSIDEYTLVSTKNQGLLVFEKDKIVQEIRLPTKHLNHLLLHHDKVYINSDLGILILNKALDFEQKLALPNGVNTKNISDLAILKNNIWVVHQNGITGIPLQVNQAKTHTPIPALQISSATVNDSITFETNATLDYQSKKVAFEVKANNISLQNQLSYHYQLVGIDEKWQQSPFTDNQFEYKSLSPGNYTFLVKLSLDNRFGKTQQFQFIIATPFYKTWWFIAIVILLFFGATFIIFKLEVQKQKKKIKLQNELNASKLIAIQSQMNPHFIFNAINSIQDLILQGDVDNSYSYIIKFSKLMRQTLDYSDKEFIDIENEIELLSIYLELEKLRFKEDFSYQIINGGINDIQVPPMLVQPFVENAIKHGLLHKEGTKQLEVSFEQQDNCIVCKVTDNGIGRKKAAEIKARKKNNHQSFSVNATQNRFKIMKDHYQENLSFEYIDKEKTSTSTGTTVIIKLPFKTNY